MAPTPAIQRLGVVAVIARGEQLLVIERSQWVAAPGAYCFPGGGIEPDESEPAALQRELLEELNLLVEPRACVWRNVTDWGVGLAWWTADVDPAQEPTPNPHEVAAAHWYHPREIAQLPRLLSSNHEFLARLARGEIQLRA